MTEATTINFQPNRACWTEVSIWNTNQHQGSQFSLSQGGTVTPPPLLEFFRGYFHPPVHQLRVRRYHCMFQAAKLSQDLNVTKSCFECSLWILSVMHTASNNRKTAVILMLIQVCFLLHGHKCFVTNGRNSHFFRLTYSTKLLRVNTPLTSKFRGSTPCTGQTWREWKVVLECQKHANCVLLGALSTNRFQPPRFSFCKLSLLFGTCWQIRYFMFSLITFKPCLWWHTFSWAESVMNKYCQFLFSLISYSGLNWLCNFFLLK